MNLFQKKQFATVITLLSLGMIIFGIILGTSTLQQPKQTKTKAEGPPFRGCVGGGEWLCMCQTASGEWWSECSIIEDSAGKQTYIDKCGGDQQKAFLQWKWDIAKSQSGTGNPACCGGQNVCGSLIPDRPARSPNGQNSSGETVSLTNPTSVPPTFPPPQPPTPRINIPTTAIAFQETQQSAPQNTNTQTSESNFNSPNFKLPSFQIAEGISAINRLASIPLGFLESIFYRIKYYDSNLENYINNKISNVLNSTINK
jgi:hypothetical protein